MTKNSTIYLINTAKTWSDLQVKRLVEALKKAKNKAIDQAVKQATIPLLAEIKVLKEVNKKQKKIIDKKNYMNWMIIIGGSVITFFIGYTIGGGFSK